MEKKMEWPSRNVPRGGLLQPARCTYSPETHKFLKLLMEENNLSMMQRKKFNYILRNNEPLPSLSNTSRGSKQRIPKVTIRPGDSKRRSRETIIQSGMYERDQFVPQYPTVDREKEKERLQNRMAYKGDVKVKKDKLLKKLEKKGEGEECNRFDQILQEIKEREAWLEEMEQLGEGKKYRHIIEQQIQEKVREMNKLNVSDLN